MITFEPAQPFAPSISAYYGSAMQNDADAPRLLAARQAQQEFALRAQALAQQGGGGYRGGGSDIQDAINHRDDAQRQSDQFNAQLNTGIQRDQYEAQSQANLQQSRFQLQAQLQDVELSQQEKMRLQRMKNAVGEVSADPSLTDDEKSDMILQLKTGIDPFQHRIATQKLAQEKLVKDQMVELSQAKTGVEQANAKFRTNSFDDNQRYIPNPSSLAQFVEDELTANPDLPPAEAEKRARERAIREGAYTHWTQTAPGKWEVADPRKGGDPNQPGHAGTRNGTGAAGAEKPPKELDDVGIVRQAKARLEATGVTPDDPKWGDKLTAMAAQVKAENRAKIDLSHSDGKPKPIDKEVKAKNLDDIAQEAQNYAKRTDLDERTQSSAISAVKDIHRWLEKYDSPDRFPPPVKKKYEAYRKFMATIPDAPAEPAKPVAGQQVPGQPPGVVYDSEGRAGVWIKPERSFVGDAQRLNTRTDQWADQAGKKISEISRKTDDWVNQLGSYLGGNK